jgi:hypothetical protein
MSISATIKTGLFASATVDGGTDQDLVSLGLTEGKHVVYYDGDTDFRSRRTIEFTVKEPKVQSSAPNGYTQARAVALMRVPLELDNGEITVNTVRLEVAVDPETEDSEITDLVYQAAQLFYADDFLGFWTNHVLT